MVLNSFFHFLWMYSLYVFNLGHRFITGYLQASLMAQRVKSLPANAGDLGSIPGSGRSPGGGHGNPLPYSCLENPMGRGAWWARVHRVTKSQTQLKHARVFCMGESAETTLQYSVPM